MNDGYANFISEGIISEKDANIVTNMHVEFRKYTERIEKQNLSDKKVLKDIEWKNLTQTAFETWNRLKLETESKELKSLMIEYDIH